jgi:hypothetical protein
MAELRKSEHPIKFPVKYMGVVEGKMLLMLLNSTIYIYIYILQA